MNSVEFGIICSVNDELKIVKRVNSFLKERNLGKLKKQVPTGVRNPDKPEDEPHYSHCYWNGRTKQRPSWYFDFYPNIDLDGRSRFPSRPDCAWTLFFNRPLAEMNSDLDNHVLEVLLSDLCASIGFSVQLLHEYAPRENRK